MNEVQTYNADEAAVYCIYYCSQKLGKSISNFQLQKILYYVQLAFLREFDRHCFHDPIVALKHGPAIQSVYRKFSKFAANKMTTDHEPMIRDRDKDTINKVCGLKSLKTAGELAVDTMCEAPWKNTELHSEISIDELQSFAWNEQ